MEPRVAKGIVSVLAVLGLAASGAANAVPCSPVVLSGGILPSISCKDGPSGDTADSAADLNAGNFFGSNAWTLLDNTGNGVDGSYWSFGPGASPNGTRAGAFQLASWVQDSFSKLAVVLNGRGGLFDGDVKWSAYLLPAEYDGPYLWTYDYLHHLTNASLYGVVATVSVPEPASLAMVFVALSIGTLVLRRRVLLRK